MSSKCTTRVKHLDALGAQRISFFKDSTDTVSAFVEGAFGSVFSVEGDFLGGEVERLGVSH